MSKKLPKEITKRLTALLRRVRRLQTLRGALGVGTVALAGLLVVMAADYFLAPLPDVARWILFGLWVLGVLVAGWAWLVRPLSRRIGLVQLARWLETRHPEIQERISTAMELSGSAGGVSESLLDELIDAAKGDMEGVDPLVELRGQRVKKWIWPAGGLAAVLVLLFAIWPGETGRLFARAVSPFSDLGNAGALRFEIIPGDLELLEGDPLEITIRYSDPRRDTVVLVMEKEDGSLTEETLVTSGESGGGREFVYRLAAATEGFVYRARGGKAESDPYRVRVWPKPLLQNVVAEYEYPGYTDLAPAKVALGRGVTAWTGTQVTLEGSPNTPVEGGKFLLDGKEVGKVTLTPGPTGGRVTIDWTLEPEASGLGQVMLTHRLGREVEGLRFPVTVQKDEPPVVIMTSPLKRELRVRPIEQIVMGYEVEEDLGIAEVNIDLQVNGQPVEALPEVMPEQDKASPQPLWRGEGSVYMGGLLERWKDAHEIKMRIAVADTLPEEMEGPGVGYSEWLTVIIDRGAESLVRQELRSQQSDAREGLAQAEREIQEAKHRMDGSRDEVARAEVPEHTEQRLEEARQGLSRAEEQLNELAERMDHRVHAAKAQEAREATAKVQQARESLEDTPLQDTGEARQAMLDQARDAAQEALDQLREMRDAVQQDEQRIEQLARLAELAQQEQQIARESAQLARQEGMQAQPNGDLRNQQQQVENALRQQMEQNPDARAEALQNQAEQARALSEQARELSAQQAALSEASEQQAQAQQAGTPENAPENGESPAANEDQQAAAAAMAERIQTQLAKEQEKIVQEAQGQVAEARQNREQRADLLPEAVSDAQQALESLQTGEPQAAAEAAHEAATMFEELAGGTPSAEEPEAGENGEPDAEGGEAAQGEENGSPESGEGAEPGEESGASAEAQEGMQQAGEASESGQGDAADPDLAALAGRQEQVAQAMEALAEGGTEQALQALQDMQANRAAALAESIRNLPQVNGHSEPMGRATGHAEHGQRQAEAAEHSGQQGQAQAAAGQHAESSEAMGQAADALDQAATEFDARAAEAAGQQPGDQALPLPPGALAEAFQQVAQGADAQTAGQASQAAQAAAQALSQAAQQAMQGMQRGQQPGQMPGQPGQPGLPGAQPGQEPEEGFRPRQGDPGVPPELARLGVSAKDWEKLKEVLRSDVAGGAGADVPEDYRGLVRKYFEQVARGER